MRKIILATIIGFSILIMCSIMLTAPRADVALAQGDDWCATCVVQNSDCITQANALATDLWATRQAPATGTPTTGPDLVATVVIAEPASQHVYAVICNAGDVAVPTESHLDEVYFPNNFVNADTGEPIDDAWITLSSMAPGVCATVSSVSFGYDEIAAQDYTGRGYVNVMVVANEGSLGGYDETGETTHDNNASNIVKADLPTPTATATATAAPYLDCAITAAANYSDTELLVAYTNYYTTTLSTHHVDAYVYIDDLLVHDVMFNLTGGASSGDFTIALQPVHFAGVHEVRYVLESQEHAPLRGECAAAFGAPLDVAEVYRDSADRVHVKRYEETTGDIMLATALIVPSVVFLIIGILFGGYQFVKPNADHK